MSSSHFTSQTAHALLHVTETSIEPGVEVTEPRDEAGAQHRATPLAPLGIKKIHADSSQNNAAQTEVKVNGDG